MSGTVIGLGGQHAHQQGAHGQLAGTTTAGQESFQAGGHGGVVDDGLQASEGDRFAQRDAPSRRMVSAGDGGAKAATMSPNCLDH